MLKKYKNKFVEYINTVDFNSHEIEINYHKDSHDTPMTSIKIILKDTPMFFEIRNPESDWHLFDTQFSRFAPDYPIMEHPRTDYTNFDACLEHFDLWINTDVKEFFDEKSRPDLLEIYSAKRSNSISTIDFSSNEKFTNQEKKLLKTGLEEIKLLIREEFQFTTAQINLIDNRIEYLEEASNRIGKTDYKGILISTILSIITSLALNQQNSEKLIRLFSKIIENIPHLNW